MPRGVYIPFGDGPRVCIGKGLAQMEAVLLLATIAQRFELDLEPGFPIVPQPSITLRPEYGLMVKLKRIAIESPPKLTILSELAIGDRVKNGCE